MSAVLNPRGRPARLFPLVTAGRFTLLFSTPLAAELADVLTRPEIAERADLTREEVAEILRRLGDLAEWVEVKGAVRVCADPDDDALVETAERGRAAFVVSGDKHTHVDAVREYLQVRQIRVLTVREFLAELGEE